MTPTIEPEAVEVRDLLVWHVPDAEAALHAAQRMAAETGALVVILAPGESLESLDEAGMAEHGWVRARPFSGMANL